jgi:hypothetical protein
MRTEELVLLLATGVAPVPRHSVGRRYGHALVLGSLTSTLLMLTLLGPRADLVTALRLPMFWVKLGFAASLVGAGLAACLRLSRPGMGLAWVPAALLAPVAGIWLLAGPALAQADAAARATLIFAATWRVCPWLITLLSLPVLAAGLWAMQGLAPTRPPLAGAAAGLLAGSVGALVYCLHCPELQAPFVGTWYCLGVLIPSLIGGLAGPYLLRW